MWSQKERRRERRKGEKGWVVETGERNSASDRCTPSNSTQTVKITLAIAASFIRQLWRNGEQKHLSFHSHPLSFGFVLQMIQGDNRILKKTNFD